VLRINPTAERILRDLRHGRYESTNNESKAMKLTNAQKMAHNLKMNQLIHARVNDTKVVAKYVKFINGGK